MTVDSDAVSMIDSFSQQQQHTQCGQQSYGNVAQQQTQQQVRILRTNFRIIRRHEIKNRVNILYGESALCLI